jgi:hypothetical protein
MSLPSSNVNPNSNHNCMIIKDQYPTTEHPCLVQVNYEENKMIYFYPAINFKHGLDRYIGNLVAIFKCKPKLKP